MRARKHIPPELGTVAAYQDDVVTREQCLGLGLSRTVIQRHLDQGLWWPVARGVYYLAGSSPPWPARAWAGILIGGTGAMLAGRAAAFRWGILKEQPGIIEVLVPERRTPAPRSPWKFIRTRNPPRPSGSPPRTPLPRTVIDLCAAEPRRAPAWLADALHSRKTTASALVAEVNRRERVPQRQLLVSLLGRHVEGVDSELEHIYARDVERAHGLPRGRRQSRDGRYRKDVDYGGLIVELDGRIGHEGEGRFRDMERDNFHLLSGQVTLRYGWQDCVERPCEVAYQVARMLRQLGWTEPYLGCPACHNAVAAGDYAA